jgi:hypothetical protein
MNNISVIQILVLISALYAVTALIILWKKTFSFGKTGDLSAPAGSGFSGIVYAFGKGMLPWEKESVAKHLPTYIGGMVYHSALLTALLFIFWDIFLPPMVSPVLTALKILWLMGAAAGIILLLKRVLSPTMRRLSCPDDFFANFFADLFLIFVIIYVINPEFRTLLYIFSILLFIYIPFGKIRHCFFFFTTRIIFGKFFGRRGVFPGPGREVER